MRIYKDLDLVEQLGAGIPRILESYSKECFCFSDNFLRMVFPAADDVYRETPQVTPQVTPPKYGIFLMFLREKKVEPSCKNH